MKHVVIAIDGPSASGKGSLARRLAEKLGYAYLDTGALYRCVGKTVLDAGGNPSVEEEAIAAAKSFVQNLKPEDLSNPALRTDEVGQTASIVAKFSGVRDVLLQFQKDFAQTPQAGFSGVILDGRDIGTVISPDADVKLFVTASVEERAKRRFVELTGKGFQTDFETVLADMRRRDERDSGRDTAPLKPAEDAVLIDTSTMDMQSVLDYALSIIRNRVS